MSTGTFGILCFSPGYGGLEINTLRLVIWMEERGWKIELLLKEGSVLCKKAQQAGLSVTAVSAANAPRQNIKAIKSWVNEHHLTLLLLPFNKDIKIAARYKRYTNKHIRLVYQQHMQVGVQKRDFIHTRRYKMLDAWISPLEYLRVETMEKTKVDPAKIHVIPFGIEVNNFTESSWTRETARAALSLPEEPLMIGVLGRIDPKKGQDLVIKGIHYLKENHDVDSHLLLLGDATINEGDAYGRELQQLVEQYGLQEKVHFRAYQPDVMQFFRAVDIFAMPAHGETFGMVTLEAMAAGVPVVGTGTDGTKELLADGKSGYLFPLNDVAAFCNQVMEIAENRTLPDMLQQAIQDVEKNYGYELMCERIGDLVSSLTSDR